MNPSRIFKASPAVAALAVAFLAPSALSQADAPLPNPPEFPFENPLLPDQDILGKFLFWDEQLSHDNTVACGTCHIHENGGTDPRAIPVTNPGLDGMFGTLDDIHGSPGVRSECQRRQLDAACASYRTDLRRLVSAQPGSLT